MTPVCKAQDSRDDCEDRWGLQIRCSVLGAFIIKAAVFCSLYWGHDEASHEDQCMDG